ncbi:S1 family peptidase [Streptomyces malaysiensis]|uniref:S1 family peptidase n=1 Tax=Streptomyces malaysiensis TaxID=92644 RepID=UPI000BFDBCF9|nr:S1 family peptidase [Streptomyces malaysiensis]ATL87224.1 putative secreted serine protease [Streptomyces malaysiensis]MCC4314607.1 S1 family peptidase [Streptomyces malaysiensis]QDL69322.1 S1 family peptidase [Streptomyces malaysiensis]
MRRKPVVRAGLSALLVLGALSGAGGAFSTAAAASGADAPAAKPAAASAPSAGLVRALGRDLGLTADQARERLGQEAAAMKLEPKAKRAAGTSYGGSWYDAGSGKLVVGVTSAERAASVRATGVTTRIVEHSADALDAAKARLDERSRKKAAPAGVSSWSTDPRAGAVVVRVRAGHEGDAAVRAFLREADRSSSVPVTVEKAPAQAPTTFAAGTVGGDPYYTGNVRCSIGFSVQGGFVTAGHCGQAGGSVSGWDGSYIGNFQGSSFPGNDYAYVSVGSGWWTVPVVLGWGTVPDQLVRGSAEAPIGASICRSGSTTHWHCGTVLAKNETVNYSQGAVHQMTKTSVCAEGGDSGGSFISGDQAQGVTSGGWGNCSSGGETWYQPVNEILSVYGLRLHTA